VTSRGNKRKEIIKDAMRQHKAQREENKMAKRLNGKRWFQISLIGVCLGVFLLSVGEIQAGKVTYVYDSLNRLTRAVYDKTTFTYIYDKTGNRLTKRAILSKPFGTVDFDADAKTDLAVYRVSTGAWYIMPSSGAPAYGVGWGGTDFKPVPGDYDGDGKTDVAIYRASDGAWFIIPSSGRDFNGTIYFAIADTPSPS
jgi:hypothetical protein